jgi:CubicO group peptidase (beta-lactamase class C family)
MNLKILFCCLLLAFCLTLDAFASNNQKIENLLKSANEKGEFSGAVLVAKGDKIIYKGAVGLANREWNISNKTSTKFRISSVTKQFTSLLIMQLVEEGKINLDAKISDYLPNFPKVTGEKVTVRNLLLSASGLPALESPVFYKNDEDSRLTDFDYVIETFIRGDLIFESGSKFNYNNADFIVLGAIIENVTGKTYKQVLTEKILKPLGMKNTGLITKGEVIENLASGYIYKDGKYFQEPFSSIKNYSSAGAMYSTLDDMFLWDKALNENKLLSKEKTEIMFTASRQLGFVALGSWVYDIKIAENKSWKLVERQGGIGGFSSLNIISPDEKLSVIFLGNIETGTLFRTYANQGLSFKVLKVLAEN